MAIFLAPIQRMRHLLIRRMHFCDSSGPTDARSAELIKRPPSRLADAVSLDCRDLFGKAKAPKKIEQVSEHIRHKSNWVLATITEALYVFGCYV